MHRPIFGHSFAVLVAPILLSVLAFKFLNKKKVGVNGNAKDAGSGASGSSTVTTEADSSGSSSLTPPSRNHYEVFLSFRGLDTRKGFIDHLYNGLIDAGIHAFKDDNELRQGEKIRPDLLAAIKNSKILIPILSVNYGESSWCLDELVQIMECKNNSTGHIVLPIFYKVEVAHVRHQIGSFGKTFQERESRLRKRGFDPMILEKWKQALIEVSSLKGFNADGYEGELVKLVVRKVLNELKKEFELVISENLVEIDRHIKKVMEFVNNNSRATLFVGIHGMGGIGKTTFAKTIYNKLSNKFEHRSFIADIRESYKRNGPEYLQNQLIHDILKHTNQVSNRDEGIRFISSKFKGEKVLILLDDVDDDDQLMALARNHNWFSLGSIIIITTRNKSILDNAEVDYNYELEEMDEDISSILFSRHAFRKDAPPSEFDVLTRDVVSTTGGLPLSLEVLGSFLRDKKPNIWRDTIKKLRKVPHKKVQEKLKISYDALEYGQQQIFLDIACFFIGTDGRIASYMWDACDFFPNEGIEVLRSMSLIKVGDDHELIMHDQLRDLGRDIICKENEREPQYRSRLWDTKEVMEVLRRNKGTSKIEALCLHRYFDLGGSYTAYTAEQFKELTNLRFFQVNNANLTGDFQNLLPQLRWLKWNNCPSDFEVTNFHPKKLIVLDLSWNQILKDWKGWGPLKVNNLPVNILPVTYNCQSLCQNSSDDLPRNVVITLSQDSPVKSMDFHPVQQILLLVGTNMGDVMVWEVGSHARIALRKFKVWDLGKCSMALQASLANDYTASVNRVMWSADGKFFGVAYSKQMVHIYSYHGGDDIRNHLEIEAHVGSVNDLAFSYLNEQLCVVTSGEDRSIKVWDTVTGAMQRSFEGHEAPVYSICLHRKENVQFIFSTSADGKIKAWLYDNKVSIVDYDAPGPSSTKIAYSADGTRLFSSGTNKEGESYLVEWNESEGAVNRTYHGLGKRSGGVVQFDTTKNGFLAAGDEFMVKFWHMDNNNLLTSTDAEGGLPAFPCIRFNKEGILLAVSTSDDTIKILANADGIRLLRTVDNRPFDASRVTPGPLMKLQLPATATLGSGNATVGASLGDRCAPVAAMVGMNNEGMADVKPRIANESGDKWQIWKLTEINEPSQCCSMRLPDDSTATTVSRLIYTNSGHAILALSSNAVHKLWKWARNDQNLTGRVRNLSFHEIGKATTSVVPQLWQPYGGNLMTNDTSDTNPEDAVPCFALSKNDSYLISVSGGKISLFNMMTFKTMTKFMPPPPPNNGIIAIGMEDSSIQVYDVHDDEVQTKLKGHKRIVIGFDLSTPLTVLVSSGSNSQTITTFIRARQAATFLAFLPGNSFIIAMGMEDSSIQIYDIVSRQVKVILRGHQKRITGLAFSNVLNVLVSSDADSQLCVWSTEGWEEEEPPSKFQQMLTRRSTAPLAITRVQFHVDQIHLLVVHETQIAIYEAPKLKCHKQWVTREASGPITDATYSCNGQSIYLSFKDGSIGVLTASELRLRCRINPAAYIPSNPSSRAYPLVIAAHPSEPNQFALGLTDGSVYVLEPLESEGEWGTSPPVEDGTGPSMTSGATSSDQPQR
ncbi:topless-related protein 4-like isoform X13 [Syzygium oleosum]|uniref:topless-related protein 4-like isoform X13 n=1 Tax=Syzygium oleosum TaxID=219896 RepID=UPI0024B97577|nr:topless-related protein 4-like isoform X13 [Syzygium oleosum]